MEMRSEDDFQALRDEVARLIADAAQSEVDNARAAALTDEAHQQQIDELLAASKAQRAEQAEHSAQVASEHEAEVGHLHEALKSRDLIGQAKGVLIVAMRCTAEHAFAVLVQQSQHENRKLVEVAAEVVERASRRAVPRDLTEATVAAGGERIGANEVQGPNSA